MGRRAGGYDDPGRMMTTWSQSEIGRHLEDMVIRGIAACPADILVHVPDLRVELPAPAVACRQVGPVLIEEFPVDGSCVSDVKEDLVLDGCKEPFCKWGRCEDGPGKVAYTAGVAVTVLHEGIAFRMMFGQETLFQP